ncbi:hypothetical protein D1Y84_12660 [Acidipila sp. EB88]|nr:hypothetical protein D1Y84_12660 [Acidipila sp. EB88]
MFNKEPERRLVIEVGSMYNELAFAFNGRTTRNARHKAAEHLVAELAKESERFDVTWRKATERETSDPFHWMNRQLREHRRDGWPQPEALSGPHNAF